MAQQNRTVLKGYFNTGDIPTEAQFADLIDSFPNISDDGTAATLTGTQTLTNKTLTAPVLGGTITGTYTLGGTPTFPANVLLDADVGVQVQAYRAALLTSPASDITGITGADAITNMVSLTQAEYDAITPNASTFYVIVG